MLPPLEPFASGSGAAVGSGLTSDTSNSLVSRSANVIYWVLKIIYTRFYCKVK